MNYTFDALAPGYTRKLFNLELNADQAPALFARAKIILDRSYKADPDGEVTKATAVPRLWWTASFERESSSDYHTNPAQGDPWNIRAVHIPKNGPFNSWFEAAIAAYTLDGTNKVGHGNWTWQRSCFEGEKFNGWGPRNHGRDTGYLWSWSNQYSGGKYVADGVWSPTAVDKQAGMIPLMKAMLSLDGSLALDNEYPR